MTIKEIFSRGEISSYTFSVCIINRIKTFYDVMLHYSESEAFKNLKYIEDKSNKELIELYNRYKDVYLEEKTNQTAFEKKYEVQLENVVTDMDEVMKTTLTPDDVFKEMEQKIEDYWSKEYCLETPQDDDIEDAVKPTSESKIVDLKSIEKQIAEYWGDGIVEKEQVPEYKNSVLSESTFAAVSDVVVDLEKIEQTLNQDRNENLTLATERNELVEIEQKVEDYWSKENCLDTPQNDNIEYAVKPTSESKIVDLRSIERQLAEYWGDGVVEKKHVPEYKNRVLSESTFAAVSDVVVDLEKIEQTLNQDRKENSTLDTIERNELVEIEQKVEDYWSKKNCLKTPQNDNIEYAVKPTSESKFVDLKSIEKQLAEYWGDGLVEKEQVPEYRNRVLSESIYAAVSDVVVDIEEIAQTLNQDRN